MREKQNRSLPHEEELAARKSPSPAAIAGFGALLSVAAIICYEVLQPVPDIPALPPPPPLAQAAPPPPVTAPVVEQPPPVQVRNPFDKKEVFEFPAGTTLEAAHAAVADTLLARARERQAEEDAKHPRKKRSRPG
jgi:hypothetical protein